ncbi:NAD(P)/FAD-dependent oxidoreductase [Streptomyces minutiscleroticus]|uniref:FAD-dependent oxidoreductase n=1 Tax=Streptomyces minutiscleroticus TaxID=68238 RepID=A0A918KHY6_9ACTN|nr:FAD-dependent oxidoreductase [Streptomyces minutiscleroticus]GGX63686.1 FAD-dependent oxidoreductase [Streptomyces minutiscleroticus]
MSSADSTVVNGGISFWHAQEVRKAREAGGKAPAPRPHLPGDAHADVAVVGGGYTGLWTAYYLKKAEPSLRITVLEREFCGYGASGRNGGWLYNGIAGRDRYARLHGHEAAVRLQRAMNDTVAEVVRVTGEEGIDADVHRGGVLEVARTPAQLTRLRAYHETELAYGEEDRELYDARGTAERVRVAGALGATWTPHGARLHPAKLVRGLAAAVEALGVTVHENTPVTGTVPGRAVTPYGTVRAPYVLSCTEGFTAGLKGQRRTWLPMNSSMIVTRPLTGEQWEAVGWEGRETLGDMAHAYLYAQRTADGRIALGGRGNPYRYGSRTDAGGRTRAATVRELYEALLRLFPALSGIGLDHTWSGVLGVPRDWCAAVTLDRATGLGRAGGYVGSGVATANLAGRTLRDLVRHDSGQADPTDLTALPWVNHRTRRWEPEPLRWLGVQGLYAAYRAADRRERAAGGAGSSRVARVADRIAGR